MSAVTPPLDIHDAGTVARRLTWRRLLVVAAAVDLIVTLVFAAAVGDLEAGAIGTGFALGLALLRWRGGLIGKLLLGSLFVDVLIWMALGVIVNVGAGARLGTVLLPAVLTGASVAGVIAVVANVRWWETSGATFAAALGAMVVAAAIIAAVVAPSAVPGTADLGIVSAKVAFDQTQLRAPAGQVTIALTNRDLFWHTFTIDALGVDLAVPVGGKREVTFEAQPGTYRYYCRIPGHESRMTGTLTVP